MKLKSLLMIMLATTAFPVFAQTYTIDPGHTYPSFEADHMGVSTFRGKFTKTTGQVVLDRAARKGSVDITIDADSLDFGHAKLNEHAKSADLFNVAQFPTITYKSQSMQFSGDQPTKVNGELTLLGVTKPVTLTINRFTCIMHPMLKREVCGGDVSGQFKRSDFGLNYGLPKFSPDVKLAIQVEAVKAD